MSQKSWQETAREAQKLRDESLKRVPGVPSVPDQLPLDVTGVAETVLEHEGFSLTEMPPENLITQLGRGHLTCVKVIEAFLRRAAVAQALTNCITELLPERALARAEQLDLYYHEHHEPIGPLHGLPVSVKEHVGMKDLGVNAGFISWWNNKAKDDAHVLKILWNAGCVFYARTTQPQSLMHLETSNNLYGETLNPFNRNLTPGGSSGGEGALLGLHGSCLGIGSDIGGSIRSPASNCGLYGFRPSTYRVPWDGCMSTMMGEEQIVPVLGPLSTSLEGIKLFMKSVIVAKPWLNEPSLVPLPWRDTVDYFPESKIRLGVMWHDGVVQPHPPIKRALKVLCEKFQSLNNVEVSEWKPYKHDWAWKIISSLYFCDGGAEEMAAIDASCEPLRPLTKFILKDNANVKKLSVSEIWQWTEERERYRTEYAQLWNSRGVGQ